MTIQRLSCSLSIRHLLLPHLPSRSTSHPSPPRFILHPAFPQRLRLFTLWPRWGIPFWWQRPLLRRSIFCYTYSTLLSHSTVSHPPPSPRKLGSPTRTEGRKSDSEGGGGRRIINIGCQRDTSRFPSHLCSHSSPFYASLFHAASILFPILQLLSHSDSHFMDHLLPMLASSHRGQQ
ncbi:hypothetical protein BT69DRAFT_268468 [Atractiella rhizophila]|nr:hypothetical protein BT69DRAFT_268468 [Atractiella rhizophila]